MPGLLCTDCVPLYMESFTRIQQLFGDWVTFIIANLFDLKLGIVLPPLDGELSLRTK